MEVALVVVGGLVGSSPFLWRCALDGIRPDSDLGLLGGGPLMLVKWLTQGMLLTFEIARRLFEGFLCRLRRLRLQRSEGQKNETE